MRLYLKAVLKAAIRIEKKVDELLKLVLELTRSQTTSPVPPMLQPLSNPTQGACPLCQRPIEYRNLADPETGLLMTIRVCGCEPMIVNQFPLQGEGP